MAEQPTVLATPHEMLRAATGHPIVVPILGGGDALLRLPTVEEFLALHDAARESLAAQGVPMPDRVSREHVAAIVRPLDI